jgi:MarR family transcriptional regulator for hemolysin
MPSESFSELGGVLGETARVWRGRLDERLRPLGLSQTRWLAILHLSKSESGLAQRELALRIGISQASLSAQIDHLLQNGWVERRDDPRDRRSKTVYLTDQAKGLSRKIKEVAAELRAELLSGLDEEDVRCCERVLRHILQRARSI